MPTDPWGLLPGRIGLLGIRLWDSLNCWDNAPAEAFFSTLKGELIDGKAFPTRAAAQAAIFEYTEVFYNRQRLHSSLGYLTPAEHEEAVFGGVSKYQLPLENAL